jgi:hypothetical protein
MGTKILNTVNLNGVTISLESDDAVPDTTIDAGPDRIKLQEDAQKPASDANAEYSASEYTDVPEDIEKANESTFFGVILKNRSLEAFAKAKGVFPSADAFFKSNECKAGVAAAHSWLKKHDGSPAAVGDIPEKLKQKGSISTKTISGLVIAYRITKGKLHSDIIFKNKAGKVSVKEFAVVKIGSDKSTASESAKNTPPRTSPIKKVFKSQEDDPVDSAFTEPAAEPAPETTPDPAPAAEPTDAPASTEPAVEPTDDITPEEIEAEAETTESFIGAIAKIIRSREEADAAVSQIDDTEIDEVVGDSEGTELEEAAEPPPPPDEGEPLTDDEKATEAWLATL